MSKADETRRAAIETRFRTMYPDLGITVSYHDARRVTVDHDDVHLGLTRPGFTVSFRSGDLGFEEHLDRNVTVEGAVKLLRYFADDLAHDHQQHLDAVVPAVTPDERGARLEETRVRIRKVVADAEQYGNTSQVVTIDDLRALLEAADIMLDGVTAAEIAEHEDRVERDIAAHEESLTDEEYRA